MISLFKYLTLTRVKYCHTLTHHIIILQNRTIVINKLNTKNIVYLVYVYRTDCIIRIKYNIEYAKNNQLFKINLVKI